MLGLAAQSSERTSLPSLYFSLLNIASADKVSDTTGDDQCVAACLQKIKLNYCYGH